MSFLSKLFINIKRSKKNLPIKGIIDRNRPTFGKEQITDRKLIIEYINSLETVNVDNWYGSSFGPQSPQDTSVKEEYSSPEKIFDDWGLGKNNIQNNWYKYSDQVIYFEQVASWGLSKRYVILKKQEDPPEFLLYMAWND